MTKINLEKLNLEGESTFEIILNNLLLKTEIRHGLSVISNEDLLKITLGVNNDKITIKQNDKMSNLYLDLPVQDADDLGMKKKIIKILIWLIINFKEWMQYKKIYQKSIFIITVIP